MHVKDVRDRIGLNRHTIRNPRPFDPQGPERMTVTDAPLRAAAALRNALSSASRRDVPFRHWLLRDVLPGGMVAALDALPFPAPEGARFDGTREANNQSRTYFTPATAARHPECREVVELFRDPATVAALEDLCGVDLSRGQLRVEHTRDRDGFWLEPHTDISVKLFTMLIYLTDDPALADAGTDLYDATGNPAGRAPYAPGAGLIFIPGKDTWHGFTPRPITGIRRSLIINYVSDEWRAVEELA